jgi:pyruvate kinase
VRSTKIIVTLGPASDDRDTIDGLIAAGADVVRINFSHTLDPDWVQRTVAEIRAAADRHRRPVAVLGDLCGPKMRLRGVGEAGIAVDAGDTISLYPIGEAEPAGAEHPIAVSIPTLCDDTAAGDRVLIADGVITGVVTANHGTHITVTIAQGGTIADRKGVNLPDTRLRGATLTAKDRADVDAGVAAGFDVFALSFVRSSADVDELRALLPARTPIIAKIERPEALEAYARVCDSADGIMVARGDLGVEVGWVKLPNLQTDLVEAASQRGILSIVATEMLESMTTASRPTRAETADVNSAVMDGASAVMVSAETAVGRDPVRVVTALHEILVEAESHGRYQRRNVEHQLLEKHRSRPASLAAAATHLAREVGATAIVCMSNTGASARLTSAARPGVPIVAVCTTERVAANLALWWGVHPTHAPAAVHDSATDATIVDAAAGVLGHRHGPYIVISGPDGANSADRIRILDTAS